MSLRSVSLGRYLLAPWFLSLVEARYGLTYIWIVDRECRAFPDILRPALDIEVLSAFERALLLPAHDELIESPFTICVLDPSLLLSYMFKVHQLLSVVEIRNSHGRGEFPLQVATPLRGLVGCLSLIVLNDFATRVQLLWGDISQEWLSLPTWFQIGRIMVITCLRNVVQSLI